MAFAGGRAFARHASMASTVSGTRVTARVRCSGTCEKSEPWRRYGMVIQVVQRLRRECVPSGDMAETEMRCLPDSKSSGGLAFVIPFFWPVGSVGSGIGNSMMGFLALAEMS